MRFAEKNATSIVRNTDPPITTSARDLFHSSRATARNRIVLRMKVPVTATPYADARAVEEPKPIVITSTATNSSALIAGV